MAKKNELDALDTLPQTKGNGKPALPVAVVPQVFADTNEAGLYPFMVGVENPVGDFVNLAREIKEKADRLKEMERYLKTRGLIEVFARNTGESPKQQISSVRLKDEKAAEDAPYATVSVKDAYPAFDVEQVEHQISELETVDGKPLKPDECLDWEVKATFDVKAFEGPRGFERARYDAFCDALQKVADKFGVENPLQCGKVRVVKDGFHQQRFARLGLDANLVLQKVLPATISIRVV